jgi:hypothetical protein
VQQADGQQTPAQAEEAAGAAGADEVPPSAAAEGAQEPSAAPARRKGRRAASEPAGGAGAERAQGGGAETDEVPPGAAAVRVQEPSAAPAQRRGGRGGGIARETYAVVERLTQADGITRREAFARLGAETGRRPGTVAAAYYRAARADGRGRVSRRRADGAQAGRPGAGAARGAERLVQEVQAALAELSTLLARQDEELGRLRAEGERYAEIRALLEASVPGRGGRRRG